jgi:hypothetical protein
MRKVRPDWPAEAQKVLDRIESNLETYNPEGLRSDARESLQLARIQIAEARYLLSLPEPLITPAALAEAIYRAAWAAELQWAPWQWDRYDARVIVPLKGGHARKPTINQRQAKRRNELAGVVKSLTKNRRSAKQILQKYREQYPRRRPPSSATIRRDLAIILGSNR